MASKEHMMNKAAAAEPKSGHEAPAASKSPASDKVGNEKHANVKGAQMGQPTDGNPIAAARKELHSQHPTKHDDLGPHHGGTGHMRHEPLHGMKPSKK